MADRPEIKVSELGELYYVKQEPVENLITWVYEEGSYVPCAKIENGKTYSIISDYIGRPVQAFDEAGEVVWETDYDIYGRLRDLQGSKNFIPFRQLGQYEDVELDGLYYNRFRYYDSHAGLYISQDPIGLAGNNPNLYGYVYDNNSEIDHLGLAWGPLNWEGMGHHLIPRAIAEKLDIPELSSTNALSWYPNKPGDFPDIHLEMHRKLKAEGVPWRGGSFEGTLDDFMKKARAAYKDYDAKGVLKFRGANGRVIMRNVTPNEALDAIEKMIKEGKIPCK